MAMAPLAATDLSSTDPVPAGATDAGIDAPDLRIFVFALFFIFGGITSLNDVIIPKLKELFTLGYAQALLVQSAFFAAYFIMSLPGAAIVRRFGYMRTAAIGLVTMTLGWPAVHSRLAIRHLRGVPVRAVRAGERHHHRPGRRQPFDLAARPPGDGIEPADLRAGVQFARHDDLPMGRGDRHPRRPRDRRCENA